MSPDEPLPHHLYGWYLMAAGRLPVARAELERAIALDPSDDMGYWELGLVYYFGHRYEDAAEQERRAIALQPKNYLQHMFLGWVLEQQGRYDEAISEITTARRFTEGSQVVASLARAQVMAGRGGDAQRSLQELTELGKGQYVSPYDVAAIYAASGDADGTLRFLEKAYEDRSGWLPLWLGIDPRFDSLRGDQRFSALMKRVGVPGFHG